jgi:prevent-host-death family protein
MTIVNMHEAKSQLSKLVKRVNQGEDVIIACDGKPAARLVPIEGVTKKLRPIGLHVGKVVMHDDFDAPLPEEFMKAFE